MSAAKKPRKFRPIKPYSPRWEREADAVARMYLRIIPCADCGWPNVKGYCCNRCGSTNPEGYRP